MERRQEGINERTIFEGYRAGDGGRDIESKEERKNKIETLSSIAEMSLFLRYHEAKIIRDQFRRQLLFAFNYPETVYMNPAFKIFYTDRRAQIIKMSDFRKTPITIIHPEWSMGDGDFRRLRSISGFFYESLDAQPKEIARLTIEVFQILERARFRDPQLKGAFAQN